MLTVAQQVHLPTLLGFGALLFHIRSELRLQIVGAYVDIRSYSTHTLTILVQTDGNQKNFSISRDVSLSSFFGRGLSFMGDFFFIDIVTGFKDT